MFNKKDNGMNFTIKEAIIFAALFTIGLAIYGVGSVLNDFDIEIEFLKNQIAVMNK